MRTEDNTLLTAITPPVLATVAVFLIPHLPVSLHWVRELLVNTGIGFLVAFFLLAGFDAIYAVAVKQIEALHKFPLTRAIPSTLSNYDVQIAVVAALFYGLCATFFFSVGGARVEDLLFILILVQLYILVVLGYRIVKIADRSVLYATLVSVILVTLVHVAGKTLFFLLLQALDGNPYTLHIRGVIYGGVMFAPLLLIFSYAGSISARRYVRGMRR